jgi:hypothetical protein
LAIEIGSIGVQFDGWAWGIDTAIPMKEVEAQGIGKDRKDCMRQFRAAWDPKSEHGMKQVQTAAHCVTEAAENNGLMMFARIGMMQAINRHRPKEFGASRKPHHWGKRKLKRDQ